MIIRLAQALAATAATSAVGVGSFVVRSASGGNDGDDDGSSSAEARCTLDAGGTTDYGEMRARRATLSTQVLTTFSSNGTIVLRCRRVSSTSAVARQTKIVVISVGSITRTAVSG